MVNREPYKGRKRRLIVALDVGTTFSGVSYCFPCQELAGVDSKIPTIIWYDDGGEVRAVGAAAMHDVIQERALAEGWFKAHWFKLHLRPKHTKNATGDAVTNIPPLPPGKSIIDVFSDFLFYLYDCTKTFITEHHPNGRGLWSSVESTVEIVLSHPNGWEGPQQDKMKAAAIQAGIMPNNHEGLKRLHFVTEGEASLHYCISNNLNTEAMGRGGRILVVDAGGGTIDMSGYQREIDNRKHSYEEISAALCRFQGSIFVTERARQHLDRWLRGSCFISDLPKILDCFDKTTKPRWRGPDDPAFINFGSVRDKDARLGINHGQLKIPGETVAAFFQPSIDCIVEAIVGHQQYLDVSTVFLVGGFSASNHLYQSVKSKASEIGVSVCRPDEHVNKVVAHGAIAFILDHSVSMRVTRFVYGVEVCRDYSEGNKEHLRRKFTCFMQHSGRICVPGIFSVILQKDTKVKEQQEFRQSYRVELSQFEDKKIKENILCYRGTTRPRWIDQDPESFSVLCRVEADLSSIIATQELEEGPTGIQYYTVNYDIIIFFGMTELAAQIAWKERGHEKRGPVRIVYDTE